MVIIHSSIQCCVSVFLFPLLPLLLFQSQKYMYCTIMLSVFLFAAKINVKKNSIKLRCVHMRFCISSTNLILKSMCGKVLCITCLLPERVRNREGDRKKVDREKEKIYLIFDSCTRALSFSKLLIIPIQHWLGSLRSFDRT